MSISNSIFKSVFTLVFALVISFTSFTSALADESSMIATVEALPNSSKFILKFENEKQEKLKVKIYNSNLQLVFSETVGQQAQIQRIYDVTAIGEGTYTVLVEGETYKETRIVTVENALRNNFVSSFSPKVTDNKVVASVKNNKGTITLKLTDSENQVLYQETINEESKQRVLSLEKLDRGVYFLQIIGQDKADYETYYID